MRRIVLDTETTGLKADGPDRIIEVAAVELNGTLLTGNEFQAYVNPRVRVDPGAFKIHGISDAFLSDKPEFEDIVDDLLAFIAWDELIIHNAPFDLGFLNKELALINQDPIRNPVVDTLVMARARRPGKRNNLDALMKDFGIKSEREGVHGGLVDCRCLAKVYAHMMQTQGNTSFDLVHAAPPEPVDLSTIRTVVLQATPAEAAAHRAMCESLGIKWYAGDASRSGSGQQVVANQGTEDQSE